MTYNKEQELILDIQTKFGRLYNNHNILKNSIEIHIKSSNKGIFTIKHKDYFDWDIKEIRSKYWTDEISNSDCECLDWLCIEIFDKCKGRIKDITYSYKTIQGDELGDIICQKEK